METKRNINWFNPDVNDIGAIGLIANEMYMYPYSKELTLHVRDKFNKYAPEDVCELIGKLVNIQENLDIGNRQHEPVGLSREDWLEIQEEKNELINQQIGSI